MFILNFYSQRCNHLPAGVLVIVSRYVCLFISPDLDGYRAPKNVNSSTNFRVKLTDSFVIINVLYIRRSFVLVNGHCTPLPRSGTPEAVSCKASHSTTQRLEALVVSIRQAVSDKCEGALGNWAPSKV
jgi:hypothetical protein